MKQKYFPKGMLVLLILTCACSSEPEPEFNRSTSDTEPTVGDIDEPEPLPSSNPPRATLLTILPAVTNETSTVLVIGGDDVTLYRWRMDGGEWSSPVAVDTLLEVHELEDGTHQLDLLGGNDNTWQWRGLPSTYMWTVDTLPPLNPVRLLGLPASATYLRGVSIHVSGEDVSAYRFVLDDLPGGAEISVSEPLVLQDLAPGTHQLTVWGRDDVGNWQESGVQVDWSVLETSDNTPVLTPGTIRAVPVARENNTLGYLEYLPTGWNDDPPDTRYPLLVYMHSLAHVGPGDASSLSLLTEGPTSYLRSFTATQWFGEEAIMIAAQRPSCTCETTTEQCEADVENCTCHNCRWTEQHFAAIFDIIEQYSSRIDENRRFITGVSLGGFGTWRFISRHPNYFSAAAPIAAKHSFASNEAKCDLAPTRIWAFHGQLDDFRGESLSCERAQTTVHELNTASCGGLSPTACLTVYEGAGHGIIHEPYHTFLFPYLGLWQWMFRPETYDRRVYDDSLVDLPNPVRHCPFFIPAGEDESFPDLCETPNR